MKEVKKLKLQATLAPKANQLAHQEARRADHWTIVKRKLLDLPRTIELLEKTIADLKTGTVTVEAGQDRMDLTPAANVQLKLRSKTTYKNESVSINLSWPVASS